MKDFGVNMHNPCKNVEVSVGFFLPSTLGTFANFSESLSLDRSISLDRSSFSQTLSLPLLISRPLRPKLPSTKPSPTAAPPLRRSYPAKTLAELIAESPSAVTTTASPHKPPNFSIKSAVDFLNKIDLELLLI